MPPQLRYIAITNKAVRSVLSVVEHGFPDVRVVRIDGSVWTVARSGEDGSVEVEEWPSRRVRCVTEWLESLECSDAIWRGVDGGHA